MIQDENFKLKILAVDKNVKLLHITMDINFKTEILVFK